MLFLSFVFPLVKAVSAPDQLVTQRCFRGIENSHPMTARAYR